MADFQKSDVVQLKSGGQKMTVSEIRKDIVQCTYFDKDNNPKSICYDKNLLKKVN
jgi:uncharacterized protein YodC (DUF2158 family)